MTFKEYFLLEKRKRKKKNRRPSKGRVYGYPYWGYGVGYYDHFGQSGAIGGEAGGGGDGGGGGE